MNMRNSQHFSDHQSSPELRNLSQEVGKIAERLASLVGTSPIDCADQWAFEQQAAIHVKAIICTRKIRDRYFDPTLFADPAWDMLLDLFRAQLDQHRVSVTSLCIASNVPATTALRWIQNLNDAGLLTRVDDPTDGRRHFIELSATGRSAMAGYFRELAGHSYTPLTL
jgi:predicted transcriptional regulator